MHAKIIHSLQTLLLPLAGTLISGVLAVLHFALPAAAQTQSLPGIIIAPSPGTSAYPPPQAPPMSPAMQQPPPPPPQQKAPVAAPKPPPRPKAKVAARPKEDGATSDGAGSIKGPASTRIGLLVNGDPITVYEIDQRARLMALGSDIQSRAQANMKALATSPSVNARWKEIVQATVNANQGKTREQIMAILQEKQKVFSMGLQKQAVESARSVAIPAMREKASKELIEEQVKLQDARRNGATPDEGMVEDLIKDLAQRNKMTPAEFAKHFAGMGVDIATLKARFRAQLAWTDAVRKQYAHLTAPSQRDLDKALVNFSGGEDQIELQLQRIVISVPPKIDQKAMAQKLAEAERMHGQFRNCRTTRALAARAEGARFEDMGTRRISSFTEPSRSLLLNAGDETMIPPTMTSSGIELLVVCGRKVIKAVEEKRSQLANEERQGAFERLSKAHLRKLMDNAIIENR